MRSDLHVHTKASGMFNLPGLKHLCQECYNEPLEVYDLLKRRGMSAITVTDHDSIEGSEALRSFSDFFLSEEVSVGMPTGSDAHALSGVGLTYTEVPGARTVNEFFAGLRAGSGRVAGEHGSYGRLTADVLSIISSFFSDMPWTAVLSPLALLVPVFSAGHWMNEVRFCRKWRAVMEDRGKRQRKLWDIDPSFEANWAS